MCDDCKDKDAVIAYLEGEVVRLHERLRDIDREMVGEHVDGDDLPTCIVCGDPGVWSLLHGVCADCREEAERSHAEG